MLPEDPSRTPAADELQHLKQVSRAKHVILSNYFEPWAVILGSRNLRLTYVDCFAGPGEYEMQGNPVEGSPVIVSKGRVQNLSLYLVEADEEQLRRLQTTLAKVGKYPKGLAVQSECGDSKLIVPRLLDGLPSSAPAFFFVDPYGHPLPLPTIRRILKRPRTEVLINLMWFQMNRDLNNPKVEARLDELFGNTEWRNQPFIRLHGDARETAFLEYFKSQLGCPFVLEFRIRHDPEDTHGGDRTKYYLLHASSHIKAALLMKDVMWQLGDEEGTFDYSADTQGNLFRQTPLEQELLAALRREFTGKELTFDQLRERTWKLPFIEKHYRSVIKSNEGKGIIITRVESKRTGVKGLDRIRFS
jgi:three-Cys-motif partner protein